MNIVFFGTAAFGLPILEAIIAHPDHHCIAAVTGPDRPSGRGRGMRPSAVAEWATERNVQPVYKPDKLSDAEFDATLRNLSADVFVVVAFRILPESLLTIPRYAFNLHGSLLPAYRGAAPIQRAIMAGETVTGLTTFLLAKRVDTGDILLQREVSIGPLETAGELAERMATVGADLVIATLDRLAAGSIVAEQQENAVGSKAPKICSEDRWFSFDTDSVGLCNLVRALAPSPGAMTQWNGREMKILAMSVTQNTSARENPGTVISTDPADGLIVATADGAIRIDRIQPGGKRPQSGAEFVRGYAIRRGDRFESPKISVKKVAKGI